jgi:hypothetical protein
MGSCCTSKRQTKTVLPVQVLFSIDTVQLSSLEADPKARMIAISHHRQPSVPTLEIGSNPLYQRRHSRSNSPSSTVIEH